MITGTCIYFRYATADSQFHNDAVFKEVAVSLYFICNSKTVTLCYSLFSRGRATVDWGGPGRAGPVVSTIVQSKMLPGDGGPGPVWLRGRHAMSGAVARWWGHQWSAQVTSSLPACVTASVLQTRPGITQAASMCGCPHLNNQPYFTSLQHSTPGRSGIKPYNEKGEGGWKTLQNSGWHLLTFYIYIKYICFMPFSFCVF